MIGRYDFNEIEPEILKYWEKNQIYQKVKERNKGKKKFYFLDGPPYTSGRVHVGTAWNKSLKDCFLRYKRMTQRYDVWDRAGYDMHGLPIAHKVQEKFKLEHKEDIEKFGVGKFVEECEKLAVDNMKIMNKDFVRMGVWMDFENAYTPIVRSFIDGEWWLIKKAHENKRLYQGKRTMTWCAHCATALAKHELEYEELTDDSIFLKFKIKDKENEYLIVWTTTPWTIPFNMGVMVNPELDYIKAKVDDEVWVLSKALGPMVVQGVANKKCEIIEEFKGEVLEGVAYEHPLSSEIDYGKVRKKCRIPNNIHTVVLSKEFVDTLAGTGLVHMAPGCGPEDYEVGHKNGIYPFNNLDEKGVFPSDMGVYSGWTAKKDDKKFIEDFEKKGCLIEKNPVDHDYAHCWRCHKPVIYRTTKQWFFKVEDLKNKMIDLNKDIKWVPNTAFNAYDSWLKNLRDNSITKQRYWGTPLPVWMCECGEYTVVGSLKELEDLSGKAVEKFHKPWIDDVKLKCKCGKVQKRIPDILDVWVDAGTVSWNCLDFPEKEDLFKEYFPADFILEGKDQIRGWYNLLMVASMVSMGKPSFRNVYMHGFVQDAMGRKMSKSQGNYILPSEVIEKYGSDALRYYMIGGANPGVDINYNMDDMKLKSRHIGVLWNLHKYLIDYSNEIGFKIKDLDVNLIKNSFSIQERYIISKMNSSIEKATRAFEGFNINEIPLICEELFLELSRTYIQLVRDKASTGDELEKQTVLYVIFEVLINVLKMFSTAVPMVSEKCYLNLKEAFNLKEESISMYEWPSFDGKEIDEKLEEKFLIVQSIIQSALNGREKIQLGVRWPIKEIIVATEDEATVKAIDELEDIIKSQVNVKDIKVKKKFDKIKEELKADFSKLQPDFKELSPAVIAQLSMASMESVLKKIEEVGKYEIDVNGKKCAIVKEHLIHTREVEYPYNEVQCRKGFLYLNQERSEELEAEGYSREVMRRVQAARKKAGLQKHERISLFLKVDEDMKGYLEMFEKQIKEKVGADHLKISELDAAKKHEFGYKEKVKKSEFEVFFDKV